MQSDYSDVHFNIALEQAILQYAINTSIPTIRVWNNPRSIILGRVQSIENEVNLQFCQDQNIPIARRITGGGTVFHDEGNLNISFFFPLSMIQGKRDIQAATRTMTQFIRQILEMMGYETLTIESGSNIFWSGKKISGSAGRFRQSWFLHHATLLHNANLQYLNQTILARSHNPNHKNGSRYFPTANLPDFSESRFVNTLMDAVRTDFDLQLIKSPLTEIEVKFGEFLKRQIYQRKSWINERKMKLFKIDDFN